MSLNKFTFIIIIITIIIIIIITIVVKSEKSHTACSHYILIYIIVSE
jgi:hypothetical protein